jgi:branched-chain amino acid aminotransferase
MENKAKGFTYVKTPYNYISYFKDGNWTEGILREEDTFMIAATSTSLHYGQQAFEGLKAYRRKDGDINLFRVMDNAKRFQESCERMMMPKVPLDIFVEAVKMTVLANHEYVPPYGTGATLYIRPFMIGVGNNLGLRPAPEYIFSVIVSPVEKYFEGPMKPVNMITSEIDRAAPHGTGDVKVGGNYAASLYAQVEARKKGFADTIFLDPKTHTKIEEVGAANFFAITKQKAYITPKSPSILNSITNRSLRYIARHMLNLDVEETDIFIEKLDHIDEAGACGTAAIVTPIGSIEHLGHVHQFKCHKDMGPVTKQLLEIITGIQVGDIPDPSNWITILKPHE